MPSRAVFTLMLIAVVGTLSAVAPAWAVHRTGGGRAYQIYLLKGFADVFSSGLDTLQSKLQSRGLTAEVHSHAAYEEMAKTTIENWRSGKRGPIVLVGHSLGADAAILMAQRLNDANVPVALLVTFGTVNTLPVPPNVAHAINYFQSNSAWHGQTLKGAGFHGTLQNVDLAQASDINHFTIEKAERLQAETLAKVLQVVPASRHVDSQEVTGSVAPQSRGHRHPRDTSADLN